MAYSVDGKRFAGRLAVVAALVMTGLAASQGAASASPPAGYNVAALDLPETVAGGTLNDIPCSTPGDVVTGGGVDNVPTTGVPQIGISAPDGSGLWTVWAGVYGNGSSTNVLDMSAVCIAKPKTYKTVAHKVNEAGAGSQSVDAVCPVGTVVLGGGGYTSYPNSAYQIVDSYPSTSASSPAWFMTWSTNDAFTSATFTAYAICGTRPAGYSITVAHQSVPATPTAWTVNTVHCPGNALPLSGGVSGVPGTGQATLASSYPKAHKWQNVLVNGSGSAFTATGAVVCAGS
jgi:hypothetical protein